MTQDSTIFCLRVQDTLRALNSAITWAPAACEKRLHRTRRTLEALLRDHDFPAPPLPTGARMASSARIHNPVHL